jgi:hypothetical protein
VLLPNIVQSYGFPIVQSYGFPCIYIHVTIVAGPVYGQVGSGLPCIFLVGSAANAQLRGQSKCYVQEDNWAEGCTWGAVVFCITVAGQAYKVACKCVCNIAEDTTCSVAAGSCHFLMSTAESGSTRLPKNDNGSQLAPPIILATSGEPALVHVCKNKSDCVVLRNIIYTLFAINAQCSSSTSSSTGARCGGGGGGG